MTTPPPTTTPTPPPAPTPSPTPEKPTEITVLSVMTLVSGVLNILLGLGLTASIVLGTLGLGILCAPITILPSVLGVFEILFALPLVSTPPKPAKPSQLLAIMEIVAILFGNVVSLVTGILALVFYNQPEVQEFFDRLNA